MAQKEKKYKYQQLMVEKGVKQPCPLNNCREKDLKEAYHFGFNPVGDNYNFTPGHKKRTQRINSPEDTRNCLYCGLSMYKSESGARDRWKEIDINIKRLLGYTHLLVGELKKDFGVMSIERGEHFTFFEYAGVELRHHFKVFDSL